LDDITRLETELAGLTGKARAQTLIRLGQGQWMAYWRTGIGAQVGLPHLDQAIVAVDEALGYLEPGDALRVQAVALLGVARCSRNSLHRSPVSDRDAGILLIEEALEAAPGTLATGTAGLARATLGQAYLTRAMEILQNSDSITAAMTRGAPTGTIADIERATENLRQVSAVETVPQLAQTAEKMLRMAGAMRKIVSTFGSPNLSSQIDVLMGSMAELQEMVREFETNGFGFGSHIRNMSFTNTEWTQHADPTDFPSAMFQEQERPTPDQHEHRAQPDQPKRPGRRERARRPAFETDVEAMRTRVRALITGDGDAAGDVFAVAAELLQATEPPSWIDEFAASAAEVVHSAEPPAGADHFLLAVALHLRSRRDGDDGGWGEDVGGAAGGDAQAAVTSLLAAAETIPDDDPDGIPVLVLLAELSPEGTLQELGARLGPLTTLLQSAGAEAVDLPKPADSLRWNAVKRRFEPAGEPCEVRTLVVVDPGSAKESDPPPSQDDVTVSYVASLSQLRILSRRKARPIAENPLFIANPRGDRMPAAVETMLLRRSFYPHSVGLGGLVEAADGTGTPQEVRARVDASLVHLACGVTEAGALELADSSELDPAGIVVEHGGLVILPPDHFQPLADILLAAGFTGVIGWRRPVSDDVAAVAYFLLHTELADVGRAPAAAVRAVRKQLRELDPASLPALLAARFEAAHTSGEDWRSLVYRGV